MNGIIKHYDEIKGFGFIEGEDNKDYFFHKNDFQEKDFKQYDFVKFETSLSKKGPAAKNISINKEELKYITPNEVYISKTNEIKGYETIEQTNWCFIGSCRESPDSAKDDLIYFAKKFNANAILNLYYYKTTGSEQGTGKGTYYYTIHNFAGTLATVGKKSIKGTETKEQLNQQLQKKSDIYYKMLKEKTDKSLKKSLIVWGSFILICLLSFFNQQTFLSLISLINIEQWGLVIFPLFFICLMFGRYTDYTKVMFKP